MNTMKNNTDKWVIKPLGEACKIIKGKKPKNSGPASAERTVPYINIKAFESGQSAEFAAPGNYPKCERDDVLIVWDGARAGLTGRAVPGYIGSTLAKVYSDEADNRYLFYFLQSQYGRINSRTKGVGIPHVDPTIFNEIPFPIAPPVQQKRIVAEIEKQFSRLDEAVANLKRVKANLKRYKAAVLKAAVEGRLVETEAELARREGRSYETGEQLLQRILETRRSQWKGKGKYKEPAAPATTDLPELPEGWVWATLGQLVWSVKDGPHFSPKYSVDGIPFISGGNIRAEGIDFSSTKYISPELHAELSKRCKPEYGDLLYTKGGTTGIARVNTETREFNVWVHVAVLKILDSIEQFYLQHALNSPDCYRQAQKYTHGVGNQDLGLTRMVLITVPLPSTTEQQRIVAEIDRRQSLIREVETQVDANLKRAERMRQSILAAAFCPPIEQSGQSAHSEN